MNNCNDNNSNPTCGTSGAIDLIEAGPIGPSGPAGSSANSVLYSSIGTTTTNTTVFTELLDTFSLPASGSGSPTLTDNGDYIELVNHFTFLDNQVDNRMIIEFGAITLMNFPIHTNIQFTAVVTTRIYRISDASQYYTSDMTVYAYGFFMMTLHWVLANIAADLSTATDINIKCDASAIGNISHKGQSITLFKI